MALKFFYNGIKSNGGKLQKAHYTVGNLGERYPENTITIYARDYSRFCADVRANFTVHNDTDSMTDYFDSDRIRVTPDHPLYAQVMVAVQAQEAHSKKRQAAWMARHYPNAAVAA